MLGLLVGCNDKDGADDGFLDGAVVGLTDGCRLELGETLGSSVGGAVVGDGLLSDTPNIKVWST